MTTHDLVGGFRALRWARPLIATALALAVLFTLLPLRQAQAAPARGNLAPSSGALFGTFIKTGSGESSVKSAFTSRERFLGRKFDIGHHYYGFSRAFPTWKERWHLASGRIPYISWAGTNSNEINAGRHDKLIRARANGVRQLGKPVFLRYFWEMDGNANRGRAGSPEAFKAAWRRIRGIFRSAGARNAVFLWCGTAFGFASGRAQQFYPGDDAVDWTCADGYNWAPVRRGSPWRSFGEIYSSYYRWAQSRPRPMMAGEFGVLERRAGEKAAWFRDAATTLQRRFPRIKAVVYFDSRFHHHDGKTYDWRVNSSGSSYQAYKSFGSMSYFR